MQQLVIHAECQWWSISSIFYGVQDLSPNKETHLFFFLFSVLKDNIKLILITKSCLFGNTHANSMQRLHQSFLIAFWRWSPIKSVASSIKSAQRHFTISLVHFNLNNAAFIDELLLLRQNRCSSAKVTFLISGQSKAFALALFSRSFFISDDPSLICFSWNTRTISRTSLCFLEMIGRLYGLSS